MRAQVACVFLLSVLTAFPSRANEFDIHYLTTYALARATGWPESDSVIIASADQGIDENKATVAALEVDLTSKFSYRGLAYSASPVHQAKRNFRYHAFSTIVDTNPVIPPDVLANDHFSTLSKDGLASNTSPQHTQQLIALGAALHGQQDAYAHHGYGGTCGHYEGSCTGHTIDSLMDAMYFPVIKKHTRNPDHPAVQKWGLSFELKESADKLAIWHQGIGTTVSVTHSEIDRLAAALSKSGLALSDRDRLQCNRFLIAAWLGDVLHAHHADIPRPQMEPVPSDYIGCARKRASVIKLPDPLYPRLDVNAQPVNLSGATYEHVTNGKFDAYIPRIEHVQTTNIGSGTSTYSIKVQVSSVDQLPIAAILVQAIVVAENMPAFGLATTVDHARLASSDNIVELQFTGPTLTTYAIQTDITSPSIDQWIDRNIHNDTLSCGVDATSNPGTITKSELAAIWTTSCNASPSDAKAPSGFRIAP